MQESGFHKQKFSGLRNPDYLVRSCWCDLDLASAVQFDVTDVNPLTLSPSHLRYQFERDAKAPTLQHTSSTPHVTTNIRCTPNPNLFSFLLVNLIQTYLVLNHKRQSRGLGPRPGLHFPDTYSHRSAGSKFCLKRNHLHIFDLFVIHAIHAVFTICRERKTGKEVRALFSRLVK